LTQYTDVHKETDGGRLSGMEKRILLLTSPCHFLTHLFILVFPAVTMPIVGSLAMPLEEVVRLSFLMYLAYGVGALPAGYIADRWQARKLLISGVYAMGLGLALAGFYPSRGVLPFALMIVGLGASIYHPAGLALISHTVKKRGYALGINGVFGNLGIAAAPFVTGILTWLFTWQTAFVVIGLSSVVTGILLSLIRIDESPHPVHKAKPSAGGYLTLFVILCVALVLEGIVYRGNTVLLPAYLELNTTFFASFIGALSFVKTQGTATLAATILTSFVFLFGILGQLLGGKLADRYDLRYAYLGVHAAAVPFLFGMALTSDYLLAISAGVYVIFSLGMQPIENSLVAALTPARWRSTGFAVKFVLVFGVGAIAVYLVGIVKTAYSLRAVYVFFGAVAFLLVLSIIGLIIASRHIRDIRN
jgi:MFS family permease